jgi:hypothetical protein
MATLHIEHRITDFDTWASAFNRFADARRDGGVRGYRVLRPVDEPAYVVIDLDFDSTGQANAFLDFPKVTEMDSCAPPGELGGDA